MTTGNGNMTIQAVLASKAEKKAKRAEKAAALWPKKLKRPKSLSTSKIESLRWKAFAAVIRERDREAGCFSCTIGSAETAGHLISRRKLATKYNDENVNGQCSTCNWADKFIPGYHDHCVSMFIKKYSVEKYHALVEMSRAPLQESKVERLSSAWNYCQRMPDCELKEKIRKKLAPLVPLEYGGARS